MNNDLFFESAGDERGTPQKLFDQLNAEFHFDLDAAARPENAKCDLYFGPGGVEEDALSADWGGTGTTAFLNPPYSKCDAFMAKAREEADKGARVVSLLPVRTDTEYWHKYIWDKDAVRDGQPNGDWYPGVRGRFLPGRLRFTLSVPDDLRAWVKNEYQTLFQGEVPPGDSVIKEWFSSMITVTGLPRMSLARILKDAPDKKLLDGAPFPSCVVIFS